MLERLYNCFFGAVICLLFDDEVDSSFADRTVGVGNIDQGLLVDGICGFWREAKDCGYIAGSDRRSMKVETPLEVTGLCLAEFNQNER